MEGSRSPSASSAREPGDLALLLFCMVLTFCLWVGGGWLLGAQVTPAADPPTDADALDLSDDATHGERRGVAHQDDARLVAHLDGPLAISNGNGTRVRASVPCVPWTDIPWSWVRGASAPGDEDGS